MGAAMAPAAKEVIRQHFEDFGRSEKNMTGSLQEISER